MAIRVSPLLVFVTFVIHISNKTTAQPKFLYVYCKNNLGNYTNSSDYKSNLNTLLSALPNSDGNGYGFFNPSTGDGINDAHAVGLCRGDAEPVQCRSCLENATLLLPRLCPNQKEAIGWYTLCMLRYSNRSLAGLASGDIFNSSNVNNVTSDADGFFETLRTLLDRLKNRAASGGPLLKYAAGNASAPGFKTVYALVQCTPELTMQECNNCLDAAFGYIPRCCAGKIGGRVGGPSCNFRYESDLFFDDPPLPPTNNATTSTQGNGSNTSRVVVIAVVSSALACAVVIIAVCVCVRKKKKKDISTDNSDEAHKLGKAECVRYSFEEIQLATDNFDEAHKLGQGGFGPVYKGKFPDGQVIAVKRLLRDSGHGQGDLEFKNEVELVAKLQHCNLVRLLGFCLERGERLLVYEFVPNASLDRFIFVESKRENLDWQTLYKIIRGIARGLVYLHEESRLKIIHRDLKASNILLDEEMHPKIADFGLAKLLVVDQTGATERKPGTPGYMAPEYRKHGLFSAKSDVFSFGVLLLEILSGERINHFHHEDRNLLSYAWRNWMDGTASNIVDPPLRDAPGAEIMRCIHIALLCVQNNKEDRPIMSKVEDMLKDNSRLTDNVGSVGSEGTINVPSDPDFFMDSNNQAGSRVPEDITVNEVTITDPYPR